MSYKYEFKKDENEEVAVLIEQDLKEEDEDPDMQQYHVLAKKGLA